MRPMPHGVTNLVPMPHPRTNSVPVLPSWLEFFLSWF